MIEKWRSLSTRGKIIVGTVGLVVLWFLYVKLHAKRARGDTASNLPADSVAAGYPSSSQPLTINFGLDPTAGGGATAATPSGIPGPGGPIGIIDAPKPPAGTGTPSVTGLAVPTTPRPFIAPVPPGEQDQHWSGPSVVPAVPPSPGVILAPGAQQHTEIITGYPGAAAPRPPFNYNLARSYSYLPPADPNLAAYASWFNARTNPMALPAYMGAKPNQMFPMGGSLATALHPTVLTPNTLPVSGQPSGQALPAQLITTPPGHSSMTSAPYPAGPFSERFFERHAL